ncbi:MAG: NAD(P)H-binding protein [Proteobacteria bacterium]|jgi:nucleoside-diphosphate-sugar epimerase|nr:NAD(P)H-binding protein [Pseudomonadota bacterium]
MATRKRRAEAAAPRPLRVCILGGTGLLGYHAALEFLRRGHEVQTIALRDIELGAWFPRQIEVHEADITQLDERALVERLRGVDALVYALGPDDRTVPDAPAYEFFRQRLVRQCERIFIAARKAGVTRGTVLGSYFTHFDRVWPHKQLAERHAYIRCRVEQARRAIAAGGRTLAVSVLELPYIFGTMPQRVPLWKEFVLDALVRMPVVFYPDGGSTMITAAHVGEAVVGAIERGVHGQHYPIGDENLSWDEMLGVMLRTLGMPDKRVIHIGPRIGSLLGRVQRGIEARRGKESGLDAELLFPDVMCERLFMDPSLSAAALGYGRGGVREAIEQTVRASYPERFAASHESAAPAGRGARRDAPKARAAAKSARSGARSARRSTRPRAG